MIVVGGHRVGVCGGGRCELQVVPDPWRGWSGLGWTAGAAGGCLDGRW